MLNALLHGHFIRHGGTASIRTSICEGPQLAETTWAYEVGAKGDLGSQVSYEMAIFYTTYEDRQVETRYLDPAVGTVDACHLGAPGSPRRYLVSFRRRF